MMKLSDLPYEHRLCAELLHYATMSCSRTKDMKCSEIKKAVGLFFDDKTVREVMDILCGRAAGIPGHGDQGAGHADSMERPKAIVRDP